MTDLSIDTTDLIHVTENLEGMHDDLPPPETKRWVIRRKAAVVAAVARGALTLQDACLRYRLSVEEFTSWQRLIEQHGVAGLRTTRLQDYRAISIIST